MGPAAARKDDRVTGADTHVVLVPSPGGPVPTPLAPHPFSGPITSETSPDVTIEGKAAATVGSVAENRPKHVPLPPGTAFQRPPSNRGTISQGSRTVTINGKAAARVGDPVRTCNDPTDADTSVVVTGAKKVTIG
jgi:uncharacterized Zn-binding protein involved in type VI secretion